jgi:hypothetical protein
MPMLDETQHHIRAHPSQTYHSKLHMHLSNHCESTIVSRLAFYGASGLLYRMNLSGYSNLPSIVMDLKKGGLRV